MPKANKDGWIRNRSGKAPNIPVSTKVEVRFRDGETMIGPLYDFDWDIEGDYDFDIMAYRVIESEDASQNKAKQEYVIIAVDSDKNVMAIDEINDDTVGKLYNEGFNLGTTEIVNITTGEKKKLLDLSHLTNWK